MSRSVLHIEHENQIITICFGYYFNFEYVQYALKGNIVFLHNLEAISIISSELRNEVMYDQ